MLRNGTHSMGVVLPMLSIAFVCKRVLMWHGVGTRDVEAEAVIF